MTGQDHGRLPDALILAVPIRQQDGSTVVLRIPETTHNRALQDYIKRHEPYTKEAFAAQAMSAGTAETLQGAQGDSPPARSEGCAQPHPPKSNDYGAI